MSRRHGWRSFEPSVLLLLAALGLRVLLWAPWSLGRLVEWVADGDARPAGEET
jgi:hypothetical protein